jgi:hypothetical protein
MSCPFFEPVFPVSSRKIQNGRLPLIQEYQGRCANRERDIEVNDRGCNQGYAKGMCDFFPSEQKNQANRYSLVSRGDGSLTLLYINEEEYSPAVSRTLHFSIAGNRLLEEDLDVCIAAQALAFCRSYLNTYGRSPG